MATEQASKVVLSPNVIDAAGLDRLMREFKAVLGEAVTARDALSARNREYAEATSAFIEDKPATDAKIRTALASMKDLDKRLASLSSRFDRLEESARQAEARLAEASREAEPAIASLRDAIRRDIEAATLRWQRTVREHETRMAEMARALGEDTSAAAQRATLAVESAEREVGELVKSVQQEARERASDSIEQLGAELDKARLGAAARANELEKASREARAFVEGGTGLIARAAWMSRAIGEMCDRTGTNDPEELAKIADAMDNRADTADEMSRRLEQLVSRAKSVEAVLHESVGASEFVAGQLNPRAATPASPTGFDPLG